MYLSVFVIFQQNTVHSKKMYLHKTSISQANDSDKLKQFLRSYLKELYGTTWHNFFKSKSSKIVQMFHQIPPK